MVIDVKKQRVAFVLGWVPWRAYDIKWWLEVGSQNANTVLREAQEH